MKTATTLPLMVLICGLIGASAHGQEEPPARRTVDREKIIDVAALAEAMQKATEPVSERIRSSKLEERFALVKSLLERDNFDKQELLNALYDLNDEMDAFVSEWDEVTTPLWDAQDTIAETIDKVRAMMAGGYDVEEGEKSKAILRGYEKRLNTLARQTANERDPVRKARLKKVYANVLSLRNLTERVTSLNLSPAAEAVQVKIIRALGGLQEQLTMATFEVERVRVVLTGLSDFVSNYSGILSGLVEAEQLAQFWAEWNGSATGLGTVFGDVDSLITTTEEFVSMMDSVASELADSIENETARMAVNTDSPHNIDEAAVDADIAKRMGLNDGR